jgi:DNA-directed RNA polymerase subunit M/transcription elongation factor TFIIS
MAKSSIKYCKDCKIVITKKNAFIDRGERLRARCKPCDYKYRAQRQGTDAYSYMDKLFSKLRYEVVSGTRRTSRTSLTWNINQAHLYNLYHKQDGKCALSGLQMTWLTGQGKVDTNISIDRIDPKVGYEPKNIQLVCYRCNIMKHDSSQEYFEKLAEMIVTTLQNKKLYKRR